MRLPFTEEQWKAAKKAGIADTTYSEEEVLDGVLAILEDCVFLKMSWEGNPNMYQEMLDVINACFDGGLIKGANRET